MIERNIQLVEEILGDHSVALGNHLEGYKNHVHRMINFCFALRQFNDEERKKIVIAATFHDLGIWTAETFDYLPPSAELAATFLRHNGLTEWVDEIDLMISQHHKLGRYADSELVECFRMGDLVDLSLGFIRCGVPASLIRLVRTEFPNAGFHKHILSTAGRWICRHPLNPLPVLKW